MPKIVAGDYTNELVKFAREGDVIYDLDLHALRICVGLSGGTPPAPIWRTISAT
jgi:hypothetical protein